MKTINWILVKSKGRGIDYGVGTFVKHLLHGLMSIKNVDIFVIEIGSNSSREFNIEKKSGITYFHFSDAWHLIDKDTISNQSKHAKNAVRILLPFIPKNRKNIIHLNFIFQYFIGNEFRKVLNATIIFTQHISVTQPHAEINSFNLEKQTYQLVDHIFTVSNYGREHLIKKGVKKEKITTVYNGVDPSLFIVKNDKEEILKKYGIAIEEKFVLYSGRIDHIKGLKYLALSFKLLLEQLPYCHLVIAGDGNYDELIHNCRSFSSNINYLGFIPLEDLIVLYKKATIGVIPSLEEHCGYVALEMLYAGLPVVASNLGGLKEIFIHNENALLVNTIPDSTNMYGIAPQIEQLTRSMYKLLTDVNLREKFSLNAIKRANKKFTSEQMTRKYVDITLNFK